MTTLVAAIKNPSNNEEGNGNNHMPHFAKNLLHQLLVFPKIKTHTGQKSGPNNRSQAAIKHEFLERHATHTGRNTN